MRILLFTGKGGVGKTTVAAATAARIAASGRRTIVAVHRSRPLPGRRVRRAARRPTPRRSPPNLWGQQLNARVRFEEAWDDVRDYMVGVLDWAGADAVEAEELAVVPGLDEVFALADIKTFATSGDYDVVVVDCAPDRRDDPAALAARRARLVHGPRVRDAAPAHEARSAGARPAHRATDRGGPACSAAIRRSTTGSTACATCSIDGDDHERAPRREPRAAWSSPRRAARTRISRCSGTTSTRWSRTGCCRTRSTIRGSRAGRRRRPRTSTRSRTRSGRSPSSRPSSRATSCRGSSSSPSSRSTLYGALDPSARLAEIEPLRVDAVGSTLVLSVHLPFTERDDVRLGRTDEELFLTVGPHRRALVLPDSLLRREVTGAHLVGDRLEVEFV